jgi:hypothetical protein
MSFPTLSWQAISPYNVFEKRKARRMFGPKRKWQKAGKVCIIRSFIRYY